MAETTASSTVNSAQPDPGRLRIVCLEEHMLDPGLTKSAKPAVDARFPYMNLPAGSYEDDPDASGENRPMLRAPAHMAPYLLGPIEDRVTAMDEHGIDMQVLSYSNFTQFIPREDVVGLAEAANDQLAAITARYPARFSGFATLPWQDPDAALVELERSRTQLGLPATMLSGHPADDALLDDPRYDGLLALHAELGVPLYIHPGPPFPAVESAYYGGFRQEVTMRLALAGWGWHNEAGIQVIRLILSGAFDRHPKLQVISGHWGEMVPFYLQRLDDMMPPGLTGLPRTISQTYRDHVWVTPSGMLNDPHFEFIRTILGSERILYSVDYPYLTMTGARAWLENLAIDPQEKIAIAHSNAEKLLNLAPSP